MQTIKAIETIYNGYRFRSRLEARWAVFFDTLGIKYEYEIEGFDLGEAGLYLPDYRLPDLKCFLEIKGEWPVISGFLHGNSKEFTKLLAFAGTSQQPIYMFAGSDFKVFEPIQDEDNVASGMYAIGCYHCEFELGEQKHLNPKWAASYSAPYVFAECRTCHKINIVHFFSEDVESTSIVCFPNCREDMHAYNTDSPRLIAAYTAARQARFEHGECP